MAIAATHIRFALDLKNKYKAEDLGEYISGTLYPDSRYMTKIDRRLTHPKFEDFTFEKGDDFEKGWFLHLVCDRAQRKILDGILGCEKDLFYGGEAWINRTAAKVFQEISDSKNFDVTKYVKFIKFSENPNNENVDILKEYYNVLKEFYSNNSDIKIKDYDRVFDSFEISSDIREKVSKKCEEFIRDEGIMKKISGIYDKMIAGYEKII